MQPVPFKLFNEGLDPLLALIEAQRAVIDGLVVKLAERKARQAALLVALTAAHQAAERGDIGDLSEALRSATAIIGGG